MSSAKRGRGRPRSEAAHRAILSAAEKLLLRHGLADVSMDEIAEAAGCSKATIYRWWPSKELLALEALLISWDEGLDAKHTDTGTLRGDLRAILRPWVKRVNERGFTPLIAALTAQAQRDEEFSRAWRERFIENRRAWDRDVFRRAIRRGEISAKTDIDLALDMIFGTLNHRLLHAHKPVTVPVAYQVVDQVLGALAASG
jgi:AcrR family transcriptional regulator